MAAAGFLSPASRGALLTALMFTYLLLAVAAGFAAVWLYGMIMRTYSDWKVRRQRRPTSLDSTSSPRADVQPLCR